MLLWLYGPSHYLPAFCSQTDPSSPAPYLSPSLGSDLNHLIRSVYAQPVSPGGATPAEVFWNVINPWPTSSSAVHIYTEPASIIAMEGYSPSASAAETLLYNADNYGRLIMRLILFPIAITRLGVCYLANQLIAQMNKSDSNKTRPWSNAMSKAKEI